MFCFQFKSRPSIKQLGAPLTRIAYFTQTNSTESRVIIDKKKFDNSIGTFLRRHSELGPLSVEVICVLGAGDQHRRQLHTDWLIQYFQCSGIKEKAVKEWMSHWNTNEKLKFVDNYLSGNSAPSELDHGVYIWPKPLVERDDCNNRTVCWVLYVILPPKPDEDGYLMDLFAAGASSKIITFESSDKDRIINSTKDVVGYSLTEGNFVHVWASRNLQSSMDIFLTKLEGKPLRHKQFKTTNGSFLLTSNNLVDHLEGIADTINNYNDITRRQNSARTNDKHLPVITRHQTSVGTNVYQHPIPNDTSEAKKHVTPVIKKGMHEANSRDNVANRDFIDNGPTNNSPTGVEYKRDSIHSSETSVCSDNSHESSSNNLEEICRRIACDIDIWIKRTMTLNSIDKLRDHLPYVGNSNKPSGIQNDIFIFQSHIVSLNKNFKNIYDNYVCFDGDLDHGQMQRFMAAHYQHSNSSWNTSGVRNNNIINTDTFKTAYQRLCYLYLEDNKTIVNYETILLEPICKTMLKTYQIKLKRLIGQSSSKNLDNQVAQMTAFNNRLTAYCISLIGRTLDLGGKLNNVVRRHIDTFKVSITEAFNQLTYTLKENEQLKMFRHQNEYKSYNSRIQQAFYCQDHFDPTSLKHSHDILVENVTDKMNITERQTFKQYVDSLFVNMVEYELVNEEAKRIHQKGIPPNSLSFFITNRFIYASCSLVHNYTTQLIPFNFINSAGETISDHYRSNVGVTKEGRVILLGNELVNKRYSNYSHKYRLLDYFTKPNISVQMLQAVVSQVLLQYKTALEQNFKTNFPQVHIFMSSWLSFEDRLLVRESCQQVGFEKMCILMESSIAAYKLLNEVPSRSGEFLVLVVIALRSGARLEIYGNQQCNPFGKEDKTTRMLAVSYKDWLHEDNQYKGEYVIKTIKATYNLALSQLTEHQRNSRTKFYIISERSKWNPVLDSYFRDEENLEKVDQLVPESILPVIDQFANRENCLSNFLLGLSKPYNLQDNPVYTTPERTDSPQISKRNEELFAKCENMERQVTEGQIKVGTLRKKIILEIIQRGKLAAEENIFGGEDEEIDELCRIYDFEASI